MELDPPIQFEVLKFIGNLREDSLAFFLLWGLGPKCLKSPRVAWERPLRGEVRGEAKRCRKCPKRAFSGHPTPFSGSTLHEEEFGAGPRALALKGTE